MIVGGGLYVSYVASVFWFNLRRGAILDVVEDGAGVHVPTFVFVLPLRYINLIIDLNLYGRPRISYHRCYDCFSHRGVKVALTLMKQAYHAYFLRHRQHIRPSHF